MGEDGFLLIEVIVSALLVGVIVIGTFDGFDTVHKSAADQRAHDQAVTLAEQSQEQLRSDPVSTLDKLQSAPHSYTTTVNGTEYTVTQEATPSNGSAESACNVTEVTKQTAGNVQITSLVAWSLLKGGSLKKERPKVSLSSVITPPAGSGLEVDVGNAPSPTAGVAGVTAAVTYKPTGNPTNTTVEGTTNSNGCFVFEGIPATTALIAITEKAGYVTPSGLLKWPTKEVSVAPNITTHYPVTYNQGGAIKGSFTYKGEAATGDTFVVSNSQMGSSPNFEVGSTAFTYETGGEDRYAASTGTYSAAAYTPKATLYNTGDLFPFLSLWAVYAGDCPANDPENDGIKSASVTVNAGATTEASVPMSKINLTVYEGTFASKGSVNKEELTTKITDTACSSASTPNNASAANLVHAQKTSKSGGLSSPYMPFGAYSLAVERNKKRYTYAGENTTEAGTSPTIYLGAKTTSEINSALATAKEELKKAEEKLAPLETAKKTEKEKETEEKAQWTKELECEKNIFCFLNPFEKKITEAEYKSKIKAQEEKHKEKEKTREAEIKVVEEAEATAKAKVEAAEAELKEEEKTHVKVEATP